MHAASDAISQWQSSLSTMTTPGTAASDAISQWQSSLSTMTTSGAGTAATESPPVTASYPSRETSVSYWNVSQSGLEDLLEAKDMEFLSVLAATIVYSALLAAAGLVGNCLVLYVYYFRFKASVTRSYILAMAVCDLLSSGLCIPSDILLLRFYYTFRWASACKFIGAVRGFLVPLSGLLLVVVAMDRFRRICQPTKQRVSQKMACISMTVCGILAALHMVANTVVRGLKTVEVDGTNITGTRCDIIGDEFANTMFPTVFRAITGVLIIGCILVMLVLYSLIGRHLWLHRTRLAGAVAARQEIVSVGRDDTTDLSRLGTRGTSGQQSGHDDQGGQQQADTSFTADPHQASRSETAERPVTSQGHGSQGHRSQGAASGPAATPSRSSNETSGQTHTGAVRSTGHDSVEDTDRARQPRELECPSPVSHSVHPTLQDNVSPLTSSPPTHSTATSRAGDTASSNQDRARRSSNGRRPSTRSFCRQRSVSTAGDKPRPTSHVKQIPKRTTWMLFVLTALFVFSFIPQRIALAVHKDISELRAHHSWGLNAYAIAVRSWFINSAVNPFVYGFLSQQFRHECRRIFQLRRRCCRI